MTFAAKERPDLLFTDVDDTDTDEEMVEEMYWSMINRHPLYILDQTAGVNLYGEPAGDPETAAITPSYTALADPQLPMHIKLDPEAELLDKYGYKRTRDAIIWFSTKILRDRAVSPKVGDRVDFTFTNETGATVVEQLEILECSPWDFARQSKVPYQITVAADRTMKSKTP